jgi:cobalamin biosynthesis protein CobW
MPERHEPASPRRVPALVVSGFLGSGKTSLVRHLLDEAQGLGLRIAVVSNELGELGVDRALLGAGGEAFVELEGGCVCCELSDDLIETLQTLHEQVAPDRVVVETSGVALPFDTQLNFWREPVSRWIGDDMAVVVVNAEQVHEGRDLEGTFQDQVSSADVLILNKIDLLDPGALPEVEARLREIEPEAPIVHAVHGRVDSALLFPPDLGVVDRSLAAPTSPPHDHEHFHTREWRLEAGQSEEQIRERLGQEDLLRAKGFVETDRGVRLVQVVGRRIELSQVDEPPPPELLGRIVLIERAAP